MKGVKLMKKLISFKAVSALMLAMAIVAVSAVFALSCEYGNLSAKPWKFGVMGDTQWTTTDPAGTNPDTVPLSIIDQVNQQFINAGVKFVIEVGDLTDDGNNVSEVTRAAAAQSLYNHSIGFFPFRGNHETYGTNNSYGIPIFQTNYPQTRGISNTFNATNFNSPINVSSDLNGMSYSFDYGTDGNKARFVIIDTWATLSKVDNNADGYPYGYTINDQQAWISSRLNKHKRGVEHAFVFAHQPLIAENHQDTMFSGYTNANPDWQNAFFGSLQDNKVKYFISGHDHIHQRSIIASPDGKSNVQEIICASNSSKFYTPKPVTDPKWYGQKSRETSVSQEMYHVGYYIYSIDGPRVTVDYYSDDHGNWQSDASYPTGPSGAGSHITPTFNFVKKETWGYSLNGKEFLVAQDQSYSAIQDRHSDTFAQILDGINSSTMKDGSGRPLTKPVNTGWSHKTHDIDSDILTLWGMADLGTEQTDVFTLSLSYDHDSVNHEELKRGLFGMVTKDTQGNWVNAVDKNFGGTKKFVYGPWIASDGLGTYGVDTHTHTVWAVINHNSDFAATKFPEKHKEHREEQDKERHSDGRY
jgi:Calcineurin-like phosphoesterase